MAGPVVKGSECSHLRVLHERLRDRGYIHRQAVWLPLTHVDWSITDTWSEYTYRDNLFPDCLIYVHDAFTTSKVLRDESQVYTGH